MSIGQRAISLDIHGVVSLSLANRCIWIRELLFTVLLSSTLTIRRFAVKQNMQNIARFHRQEETKTKETESTHGVQTSAKLILADRK